MSVESIIQKRLTKQTENMEKHYYLMYLRKSSEDKERQIQSLDDQEKENRALANRLGIEILETFLESKSAKQPGRLEFNRMLSLISERDDIKGIIAWELNRLSRNPIDSGTLQWLLQNSRIEEIVTSTRTYKVEDAGLLMSMENGLSTEYIIKLKKDTMRGLNSKISKGIAPVLAPAGYYNDTLKVQGARDILPHPTYFPLMRKLFEMFMTHNYSVQKLVDVADEMGIKNNRGGKKISKSQLYKNLQNPFYTGRFLYKGELHQGKHEQMLSDAEYELIQEILKDNGKSRPQQPLEFPLNGFVKCKNCGMAITGERHTKHYKNGTSQEVRYYRCSRKNKDIVCTQPYIKESDMETQVKDFLKMVEIDDDLTEWSAYWCNYLNEQEKGVQHAHSDSIQKEYKDAVEKLDNLLETKISPLNKFGTLLSEEDYSAKRAKLIVERDRAKKKLDELDKRTDEWDEMTVATFDFAAKAKERFESGGLDVKQLIMRGVGSYLQLSGENLEIYPRTIFVKIKEANNRLVPNKKPIILGQSDTLPEQNIVWGG